MLVSQVAFIGHSGFACTVVHPKGKYEITITVYLPQQNSRNCVPFMYISKWAVIVMHDPRHSFTGEVLLIYLFIASLYVYMI